MIWDIDFDKHLQQGATAFDLQVRIKSDALRLVLFGPSGAGKTLTLKTLAGLLRPDRGHLRLSARTLFSSGEGIEVSPQQRRLAFVFQDYALFPHLSVRQNIGFALSRGWTNPPPSRSDEAVDRWIEAFGLRAVVDLRPHQISGGQRQRTALARALLNEPKALLLDEPFAALDKLLRERLREELIALQQQLKIPMLVITHDADDLKALTEEAVELHAGRVVGAQKEAA